MATPADHLKTILCHLELPQPAILHFEPGYSHLRSWAWPLLATGERVPPSDLAQHRRTHIFKAPGCLCGYIAQNGQYTETALYIPQEGRFLGEYVAGCSTQMCGYLVSLDRMYLKNGLRVGRYLARGLGVFGFPEIPSLTGISAATGTLGLGQPLTANGSDPTMSSMLDLPPPEPTYSTVISMLLRLGQSDRPGLPEAEFVRLFARCRCGLIVARCVFHKHECLRKWQKATVIDLTLDDQDSDAETEEDSDTPV